MMLPEDRVQAEIRILRHHTSELKSVDLAATIAPDQDETLTQRLARLAGEE